MLKIKKASLRVSGSDETKEILSEISVEYPLAHFGAIIGPSGCGKTSLLNLIAGNAPGIELGEIYWNGENLNNKDFHSSDLAYVPQFSIAHDELTAWENVWYTLSLRVSRKDCNDQEQIVDNLLDEVGIAEFRHQKTGTLSGGQRRRLSLAMELTSCPEILLCDEVTSGLDPHSVNEVVRLLRHQAQKGRLVLSVTHSLEHLEQYDSILVLCRGLVVYHGSPSYLLSYFQVENPTQLYGRLSEAEPVDWAESWMKTRAGMVASAATGNVTTSLPERALMIRKKQRKFSLPSPFSQSLTLWKRRNVIFLRSISQILLQLGLILGFPLLVTIFAWDGLPAAQSMSFGLAKNAQEQFEDVLDYLDYSSEVGSVVSGIVMFQVILLTLMAANNSGREIAAERAIFEKEKLAGLSPGAYVLSKVFFLTFFVVAQSVWMAGVVRLVCQFPGDFASQLSFLILVNAAITAICLGISSVMPTVEQASLASIYLVGFQLPLSGAVLALPDSVGLIVRPFISAYWSWSGILQTLTDSDYYDIVKSVAQSPLSSSPACFWVLGVHIFAGLALAWIGCDRKSLT